jgi:hypothetical protein
MTVPGSAIFDLSISYSFLAFRFFHRISFFVYHQLPPAIFSIAAFRAFARFIRATALSSIAPALVCLTTLPGCIFGNFDLSAIVILLF